MNKTDKSKFNFASIKIENITLKALTYIFIINITCMARVSEKNVLMTSFSRLSNMTPLSLPSTELTPQNDEIEVDTISEFSSEFSDDDELLDITQAAAQVVVHVRTETNKFQLKQYDHHNETAGTTYIYKITIFLFLLLFLSCIFLIHLFLLHIYSLSQSHLL